MSLEISHEIPFLHTVKRNFHYARVERKVKAASKADKRQLSSIRCPIPPMTSTKTAKNFSEPIQIQPPTSITKQPYKTRYGRTVRRI